MSIGNKIENLRKKKKMSQEKLADLLGISRQTLSNYENDITSPDLNQSKKICEIFDVSLDELIGNDSTISSKLSNTERLVKKQNKTIKIILITLYFIIMIFLISFIIYILSKKDFTKEYQVEFTCNNKNKESISVVLEGNEIIKHIENENIFDKQLGSDFIIETTEYHDGKYYSEASIYAGETIGEALYSLKTVKKALISNGFKCH